jgi:hypothetical protein
MEKFVTADKKIILKIIRKDKTYNTAESQRYIRGYIN